MFLDFSYDVFLIVSDWRNHRFLDISFLVVLFLLLSGFLIFFHEFDSWNDNNI